MGTNGKLTDAKIKALRPRKERYTVWDGSGFGVRVSPRNRKSFVYVYHFGGKPRRMTFGCYPRMTLATARKRLAAAIKLLNEDGIDPGAKFVQAKRAARHAPTVTDISEEYIEKHAKPKKRSWRQDERMLNNSILITIGHRKARDITRRDVVLLLDDIVERGAGYAANRTLQLLRRVYNFAISRDLVSANPCAVIELPTKETPNERFLTEDEIRKFWTALITADFHDPARRAILFQLTTGQRKQEVRLATWQEFQEESGTLWWTIPSEHSKNGRAHRLPITDLAGSFLVKDDPVWVFPSPRRSGPMISDYVSNAIRNLRASLGMTPFGTHVLRHTFTTMARKTNPTALVGKVLGHKDRSMTGIYDQYHYDKEKLLILEAWERKLREIIGGEPGNNIVDFKRQA